MLNLILTNKERLVRDVKVGDSLSCGDHEMITPKDMGILMYKSLNMSQQCARAAKQVSLPD